MKKFLLVSVLIGISLHSFSQWVNNAGPPASISTANTIIGIGQSSPGQHTGYSSLSLSNATNGGYIDFLQGTTRQGWLTGDANGLSLFSGTGDGLHIYANNLERLTILSTGNMGINQTAPVAKFQITGTFVTGSGAANLDPGGSNGNITYLGNSSGNMLIGWNRALEGESDFIANRGTGSGGYAFFDYSNATSGNPQSELMRIRSTGEVMIGVTNWALSNSIGSNKLAVGGGIITEAVTVKAQGSWPDYVFKPNFKPVPLSKLKAYIDVNHHLPEVPSEAEINKDGQNLGEMNKLLLKKVEELTLYMIEKDKQLKAQEVHLKKLEKLVNVLAAGKSKKK